MATEASSSTTKMIDEMGEVQVTTSEATLDTERKKRYVIWVYSQRRQK